MSLKVIDASIESAMEHDVVRAPIVNLKTKKSGKPTRTNNVVRTTIPPMVGDSVVRIVNECDPIGFLSDVVNGKAIQVFVVDEDGDVYEFYETPNLNQRIRVARYLADKVAPTVAVVKHAHLHMHQQMPKRPDPDSNRSNLRQIASHAASRYEPSSDE